MERLDRFMANPDWLKVYLEEGVEHLSLTFSNHYPLILETNANYPIVAPRKPLRIEPMWLSNMHKSFNFF